MSATVQDVMTSPVTTISLGTDLREAAARLHAGGFSALPVVDAHGLLVGVLSEADLLVKTERPAPNSSRSYTGRERSARWAGTLACHLMSRAVVTIVADAPLAEAAQLMLRYGLKRLPVVDGAGRPVGIVSRGDLLKVFLHSDEQVRRDVQARLRAEELSDIVASVEDGVVTLRGAADEASARRVVEEVDGVVAVRCPHRGAPAGLGKCAHETGLSDRFP